MIMAKISEAEIAVEEAHMKVVEALDAALNEGLIDERDVTRMEDWDDEHVLERLRELAERQG